MSEKKSDIQVVNCSVRYDGDVPVFSGTTVTMKGTISRKLGDKVEYQKNVTWTCDLDGVPVCDCLEPFGASIRIKMAVVRDRDDYKEVIERLDGSIVHFNDIGDWTDKGEGKGRQPMLVKWLVSTGKFDAESARAVYDDPARRAKAQEMFDRLMKQAEVDDL